MTHATYAIAQDNFLVGDLEGNFEKIAEYYEKACNDGVDFLVFPELALCGYPPEDQMLSLSFQASCMEYARRAASLTKGKGPAMLLGAPWIEEGRLYNAVLLLADGEVAYKQYKFNLPNYGVFDEKRVFDAGQIPQPIEFRGVKLGLLICEDMWRRDASQNFTDVDIIIACNASPFTLFKEGQRQSLIEHHIEQCKAPYIYTNIIGGQDDIIFDGHSMAYNAKKKRVARLSGRWPDYQIINFDSKEVVVDESDAERVYAALTLGVRDYVRNNGFSGVVLGMSGGVDSALTAALATDALGPENVWCIKMPSRYTSDLSFEDANFTIQALGVQEDTIEIEPLVESYMQQLAPVFEGKTPDLTEENLQSRIRGTLLMAISNKHGHMLLTTGNKSEYAMGYATLYGDMCGGYAAIKDIYKYQVFDLCRWRNSNKPEGARGPEGRVFSESVLTKPPTAELRHNQKDEDSLPPYELLDKVLYALIEDRLPIEEVIMMGFPEDEVRRIYNQVHFMEYKRRQSAPGGNVSLHPFGRDRRYPITNKFRV